MRSGECGVPISLPLFPDPLWPEVIVTVRVSSIGQINLWKLFIFDSARKPSQETGRYWIFNECDSLTSRHKKTLSMIVSADNLN